MLKEKLKKVFGSGDTFVLLFRIRELFSGSLKLELNEKTQSFPIKNVVKYLGWRFNFTEIGKVVRKLQNEGKRRTKRRFRRMINDYSAGTKNLAEVKRSLVSTYGFNARAYISAERPTLGAACAGEVI